MIEVKITKMGKRISAVFAVICTVVYIFGGLYLMSQPALDVTWGMAVFFACLYWFTELEIKE